MNFLINVLIQPFSFAMTGAALLLFGGLASAQSATTSKTNLSAQWLREISHDSMKQAIGVAVHGHRVMVSDPKSAKIFVFNREGDYQEQWPANDASFAFGRPMHIAAGSNGELYVTDHLKDHVWVLDTKGQLMHTLGRAGTELGAFDSPSGVAVTPQGRLFVSDFNNHRVQRFSPKGKAELSWGREGHRASSHFYYPTDAAVGPEGLVYVADAYNHRIQVFNQDGTHQRTWGVYGSEPGAFIVPVGLTVDRQGKVFVADQFNHRVQVFKRDGSVLGTWGTKGRKQAQFDRPNDVAVDDQGQVYVAGFGNARVQVFQLRNLQEN